MGTVGFQKGYFDVTIKVVFLKQTCQNVIAEKSTTFALVKLTSSINVLEYTSCLLTRYNNGNDNNNNAIVFCADNLDTK